MNKQVLQLRPQSLPWMRVDILLLQIFALIGLVLGCGGCTPLLTHAISSAPNRFLPVVGTSNAVPVMQDMLGIDDHLWIEAGPPQASLAVSIIEPVKKAQPPRGTVLVVHGIGAKSFWMMGIARQLSQDGYRAVLVDLRGHGGSTGGRLTYGVREAQDLSQVIDELERRQLIAGKLGVYGISYGATTAVHLAGVDPRVAAVVAVAPFSSMRAEVPHYVRTFLPGVGHLIPEQTFQQAIDDAGHKGKFDPNQADAALAIQQTIAPVLLVHGTADVLVPKAHSLRIHAAARDHSKVLLVPGTGHIGIWFDPTGDVKAHTREWFDHWLAGLQPSQPVVFDVTEANKG